MLWLFDQLATSAAREESAPTNGGEVHRPRFIVRPAPSSPETKRPTRWYVLDRVWLFEVVGRFTTVEAAEARADELNRGEA